MTVTLYWQSVSHPSRAARMMLDLKGVDYKLVEVLPLSQRLHLRLAGFRGGTVPALKLGSTKIQGSRAIARALDERWREPPLFPDEAEQRAGVEEVELWGEQQLQPIPRRLFRFAVANYPQIRRWAVENQKLPAPGLAAAALRPLAAYYARTAEADGRQADENGVRADLVALPRMLDRVDALLASGTLTSRSPNAAALQILSTVNALEAFEDIAEQLRARPCVKASQAVFEPYPARLPSCFPPDWLRTPI